MVYRVGDALLLDDGHGEQARNWIRQNHRDTIVGEYLAGISSDEVTKNWAALDGVMRRKCTTSRQPDEVLMGIRLGDILCIATNQDRQTRPPTPPEMAVFIREHFPNTAAVSIITGNHTNSCVKETTAYLDELQAQIPEMTIERHGSSTREADDDFCRFASAREFVAFNSRFSDVIEGMRTHRGLSTIPAPTIPVPTIPAPTGTEAVLSEVHLFLTVWTQHYLNVLLLVLGLFVLGVLLVLGIRKKVR
tara:strand:+ start:377 stop:1120 length:744 start_codon:yes stop_codon:yes gene_type:complete